MKTRLATIIAIAALLNGIGSLAANACPSPINLPAIEQRMADPGLDSDVRERAKVLKSGAMAAIEAGERDEGRRMYYKLMSLLGIVTYSGPYRCG